MQCWYASQQHENENENTDQKGADIIDDVLLLAAIPDKVQLPLPDPEDILSGRHLALSDQTTPVQGSVSQRLETAGSYKGI